MEGARCKDERKKSDRWYKKESEKRESEAERERGREEDDLITIAHSVNHLPLKNMKIAKRQGKPDWPRCAKHTAEEESRLSVPCF